MARNPRRANGARRNAVLSRLRAIGGPCWICGLPIDYGLPAGDPLAFECDELVPVSKGGSPFDIGNAAPSHRLCNQWKSDRMPREVELVRADAARQFGRWRSPLEFVESAKAVAKAESGRRIGTPVRHPKTRSNKL